MKSMVMMKQHIEDGPAFDSSALIHTEKRYNY